MAYFRKQIGRLNEGDGPIAKSLEELISEWMRKEARTGESWLSFFFKYVKLL